MKDFSHQKQRIQFTLGVAGFVALLLAGEIIKGGVVTHHLLASADMPGISNWWGMLSVPALAWILFPANESAQSESTWLGFPEAMVLRFMAAIAYGAIMAAGFEFGRDEITSNMLLILFPVGIFYPLYRGELVVGFVMGMTYTFGGVLPVAAAGVVGIASLLTHWLACLVMRKFTAAG
ncbi:MAG: hypothetical protein AB8B95_14525 [Pseudohongiellaceae bacterium]